MKIDDFFENFELMAEVQYSVRNLRELILQLAVHGKLVPQNPTDEPALVLLKKIRDEKEKLVKESKIKKEKTLAPVLKKEYPYELPFGWQWLRLGDYAYIIMGQSPESKYYNKEGIGLPFYQGKTDFGKLYPAPSNWCEKPKKIAEKNDILISVRAPVGPTNICTEVSVIGRGLTALRSLAEASHFYLLYSLRAFEYQISELGVGSTFTAISKNHLDNFLVPIPPLEEQKRIVAKVDQFMALCDQLEARQQEKHELRIHLNNAALDKLLTAPTSEEFAQHWQRICDNFDLLYDAPETVGQLRQAILQLAVQGKLVAQDEEDEPAAVLLEKISAEKDQLVKQKNIKRIRALPPIDPQQIPYELPYNWEWVRLGEVGHDCGQKKPDKKFTYIDVSAINKEQGIISDNVDILEPSEAPSRARKLVSKGSVIYATVRPYLLNIAIIDKKFEPEPIVSTAFAVLHPYSGIFNKYLYYYLRSKPFIKYVESEMIGMAYPAINDGKLYKGLVPIPPFEEQKRIVAKVDQLMALCDELEAGLVQVQTDGGKLMEAVVHHVLAE